MNKYIIRILTLGVFLALVAGFILIIPKKETTDQSTKLQIAATIFPLQDIAKNIVKDKADVKLILPPGASPHTFEFTPRQVKELQNAKMIFAIGHRLDSWINRIENSLPGTKIVTADKNITLRQTSEIFRDEPEEEEEGLIDPHYWLTIPNAKIIAQNITEEIIVFDKNNEEFYKKNLEEYIKELDGKDKELKNKLQNIPDKKIVTLHDAWYYFAEEYGINIVGTFEPAAGREPTPQYLTKLKDVAEKNNIKVIFSEPQVSTTSLEPFAKDLGLRIEILDPIEGVNHGSYLEGMEYNINTIIEELKAD